MKPLVVSLAAVGTIVATAALAQAPPGQPAPNPPASAQTTPAAADTVATLQKACLPILRGEHAKQAAQAAGFKLQDGGWVLPIAGEHRIDLAPPDAANPHVCTLTITAAPQDEVAMRNALGAWAAAQRPPLVAVGGGQDPSGVSQGWVISTWSAQTAGGVESVVLTQPQRPAGSAASQAERSTLLISLSPS